METTQCCPAPALWRKMRSNKEHLRNHQVKKSPLDEAQQQLPGVADYKFGQRAPPWLHTSLSVHAAVAAHISSEWRILLLCCCCLYMGFALLERLVVAKTAQKPKKLGSLDPYLTFVCR